MSEYAALIAAVVCFGVAAGAVWYGRGRARVMHQAQATSTSRVADLAPGVVEVAGAAAGGAGALATPFTGEPCVYYRFKLEEMQRDGDKQRWRTVRSGASHVPLSVDDGTGSVPVDVQDADVDAPRTARYEFREGMRLPDHVTGFLRSAGDFVADFFGGSRHLRVTEYAIRPGQPLYVLGTARADPSVSSGAGLRIGKGARDHVFMVSTRSEQDVEQGLRSATRVAWVGAVVAAAAGCALTAVWLAAF